YDHQHDELSIAYLYASLAFIQASYHLMNIKFLKASDDHSYFLNLQAAQAYLLEALSRCHEALQQPSNLENHFQILSDASDLDLFCTANNLITLHQTMNRACKEHAMLMAYFDLHGHPKKEPTT